VQLLKFGPHRMFSGPIRAAMLDLLLDLLEGAEIVVPGIFCN
jgi:hypothetical protein